MAYKLIDCGDHRKRRSFSRIRNTYALGDLLEIQKKSYNWFIEKGIEEVFKDLFPVENFAGTLSLEFRYFVCFCLHGLVHYHIIQNYQSLFFDYSHWYSYNCSSSYSLYSLKYSE